ncbi:MAG: primosomal protein N' [Anaeroplasmataceae bacterium]|nr:primosomal protein N' [Anaeroplasmataceae bacterium]
MIASVIVNVNAKQVNRSFDYLVPKHLENVIDIGYRVRVLFGNRTVTGYVIELKNKSSYKKSLKEISDLVDVYPVLTKEAIDLARYIAEHNFSFYAVALDTMIPAALKIKYQKIAKAEAIPEEVKDIFNGRKEIILDYRTPEELSRIFEAYKKNLITLDTKLKKNRNETFVEFVYIQDDSILPTSKQGCGLLTYLQEIKEPIPIQVLVEDSGYSKTVVKTLLEKKILGSYKKEILKEDDYVVHDFKDYELNESQKVCYKSVSLNENKTYVFHGVTGSGKTLVYMKWIEDVLKSGKEALMLVPEISLTPQITAIFKNHFGKEVAIMHSRLTMFERYSAWKRILDHQVKIVIGARSAIFAPLTNLGIIIIDEAHESSYIQDNNPKYNALEIASIRSKTYSCPLILGSATPNVCDYYKAIHGEYELLSLPIRANQQPLPKKIIVDMAEELKQGNKSVFSSKLKEELLSTYKKKEQSILFLNRRGHSSFVMCRSCGEVLDCPHCDVSLTYHRLTNTLKCHHCGYSRLNVTACPSCNSDKIRFVGSGTEKVFEEISNLLPDAKVLRVDLDTTKKVCDYEEAFTKFKNHEADILVGTQMIAKGLDFADVTLVGIINADLALHYPNYDSNMVAFNLIEQVSGRAGRGTKTGKVIIQTYKPKHFVIQSALFDDYDSFFKKEIEYRRITNMPPFSSAIEISIESKDAQLAYEEALNIIYVTKKKARQSLVLGPAEALPFKIKDVFRYTIQLKIVEDDVLDAVKEIYPLYQDNKNVTIKITRM